MGLLGGVISSFGFNGVNDELMHVTIEDEQLIDECIPMSHDHFILIQRAIKRAHDIGVDKTIRRFEEAVKINKPYL